MQHAVRALRFVPVLIASLGCVACSSTSVTPAQREAIETREVALPAEIALLKAETALAGQQYGPDLNRNPQSMFVSGGLLGYKRYTEQADAETKTAAGVVVGPLLSALGWAGIPVGPGSAAVPAMMSAGGKYDVNLLVQARDVSEGRSVLRITAFFQGSVRVHPRLAQQFWGAAGTQMTLEAATQASRDQLPPWPERQKLDALLKEVAAAEQKVQPAAGVLPK